MELKSRTLYSLYPDVQTIEGKALKFLQDFASVGHSQRAMGRTVGISATTVASIFEELKSTEIYTLHQQQMEQEIQGFKDLKFESTIFSRYEAEIQRLEGMINSTTDIKLKNQLIKTKHGMLRDQLKTFVILHTRPKEESSEQFSPSMQHVLEKAKAFNTEAWEELN